MEALYPWLEDRIILNARLDYGLRWLPAVTYKVFIPPVEHVLSWSGVVADFWAEQDSVVYVDVRNFFAKAADRGVPPAIELLYVNQENVLWLSAAGDPIVSARDSFVSKETITWQLDRSYGRALHFDPDLPGESEWRARAKAVRELRFLDGLVAGAPIVEVKDSTELDLIMEGILEEETIEETANALKLRILAKLEDCAFDDQRDEEFLHRLCRKVLLSAFVEEVSDYQRPKSETMNEALDYLTTLLPLAAAYPDEANNHGWILNTDVDKKDPTLHWTRDVDHEDMACGVVNDETSASVVDLDEVPPRHKRICDVCADAADGYTPIENRVEGFLNRMKR